MLASFCVWCKDIGPGTGGLADRLNLLRFQSCSSHLSLFFFLCPSEVCVERLLCLCVTLRLQEIKSNNNLQLLLFFFFKCTQTSFKNISGKHVASRVTC